jgi:hypothetical protein
VDEALDDLRPGVREQGLSRSGGVCGSAGWSRPQPVRRCAAALHIADVAPTQHPVACSVSGDEFQVLQGLADVRLSVVGRAVGVGC